MAAYFPFKPGNFFINDQQLVFGDLHQYFRNIMIKMRHYNVIIELCPGYPG